MLVLGVEMVAIWIGIAFLVGIGAAAGLYVIHLRLLSKHARRVQAERSLALTKSRISCKADIEVLPGSDRPVVSALDASSAWAPDTRSRRWAERRQHGLAGGSDG
jgi:hypothetical protein